MPNDPLIIAGRRFRSRLMVGTGKFPSAAALKAALDASGAEIVTVALRRVDLGQPAGDSILSVLDPEKYLILPNTSGARTADEAVRLAKMARAMGLPPLGEAGTHPGAQVSAAGPGGNPEGRGNSD